MVYQRNTRHHITHTILLNSNIPVPSHIIGGSRRQAAASLSPVFPRHRKASVPQKATKAYRKRKRQDQQRMVIDGKRVTRVATYMEERTTSTTSLLNRKRTGLSIAMASNPDATSQRLLPEQRTKRKRVEEIARITKFQKK